ncbi:MAG: phage tail protein [Nostoc sp.]|uniref:phage tail protein n=1 Tax=Nostoc sp. TaxID=1180 RepID=UPI002FFC4BF9
MTQAKEFLTSFSFYLQIDGVVDNLPIKSFSTAQVETEVPSQIMGTSKQGKAVLQATPTVINSNPIELTVITMIMDGDKQFFEWFKKCIAPDGGSRQVMTERKSGSVFALKQEGTISYQCDFKNAFPKSYQPAEFDASSGEMATEQWTIVCESLLRTK